MLNINEILVRLTDAYESKFKSLTLSIEERNEVEYIVCKSVDTYGIKNKAMFRITDDTNEEAITTWLDKIARNTFNVMKLNNWLQDKGYKFVSYRYIISKNTIDSCIVYSWDYNSVIIALSSSSLDALDKVVHNLDEIENYIGCKTFKDFVTHYLEQDYIKKLLGISFKTNDIYTVLEEHQLKKDDVLNKIHKITKKPEILTVSSVLASSTFEILCKINWVINFDAVSIDISFEENQIFSTRDNEFIRDPSIIDGLIKLYKPAINDIFL